MISDDIKVISKEVLGGCRAKSRMVATAESCTGGLISGALTEIPGSSDVFDRGFVTYSNEAKIEVLGVPSEIIEEFGAVSAECAVAMAEGALNRSNADVAVSVTGVAGPDGGTEEKPVGLVWFGLANKTGETQTFEERFDGDRSAVREQTVNKALELIANA